MVTACLVLLALVTAGCGSSSEAAPSTGSTSGSAGGTEQTASTATTEIISTTPIPTASTSTAADNATSSNTVFEGPGPYRVAEEGSAAAVLRWDSSAIWLPSHTGEWIKGADGPFVEVAQLPYGDVVFQRVERESVIWLLSESGPQELLVAGEDQWLTLEGAGENDVGERIVLYQKHEFGTPDNTRSSLRTYNLETSEVIEILETGAWESGASFGHLSSEPIAVLHWWSEATLGNAMVDLGQASQLIWEQAGRACNDGERDCIFYEHATVTKGRSVGVRPIENESSSVIDQVGVFEFDLEAGTERLIVAFPWDNGLWYVEDIFGFGPSSVVLSLSEMHDGAGKPLPAVVISIDSGEAFTLPDASFVRPAYLS